MASTGPHRPPSPAPIYLPASTDDAFPPDSQFSIDLPLDDDGLTTLEKIYLYSRSKSNFHRVFIVHALPSYLHYITPQEAIEYVLPLISGLAMDEDESVKEALAAELVPIIWWFFTHCQIIPDDLENEGAYASSSTTMTISVQAFTPIFGTLLLSSNPSVGRAARLAIVHLLSRMRRADSRGNGIYGPVENEESTSDEDIDEDCEEDDALFTGMFKFGERNMFRHEILHQVVIGMGRLDIDMDINDSDSSTPQHNCFCVDYSSSSLIAIEIPVERETANQGTSAPGEVHTSGERSQSAPYPLNPYFPALTEICTASPPATSTIISTPLSGPSHASPFNSISPPGDAVSSSNSREYGAHRPPCILHRSPPESAPTLISSAPNPSQITPSSPNLHPQQGEPSTVATASTGAQGFEPLNGGHHEALASSSVQPTPAQGENSLTRSYGESLEPDHDHMYGNDESEEEQAAIGRLSSMSLMAAVTATGSLGEDMKRAFVKEVERVGRDASYFYVRREASLALGALAKVVPEEIVICSLLPLFDSLRWDPDWQVRHSALFALPAILPRLSPPQRRTVALETLKVLSSDVRAEVRSGVLEVLGEVLYTFYGELDGPPDELLDLFLGRKKDKDIRNGQHEMNLRHSEEANPLEAFFTDPERPLICAFNFPAIALTLGASRWNELRETYLDIAHNRSSKVRRTLAASLGQLAKIIGPEASRTDLIGVWWDAVSSDEEGVRSKAVQPLDTFLEIIGRDVAKTLLQELLTLWNKGVFRGWRERESIVGLLEKFFLRGGNDVPFVIKGILFNGLQDSVAAVRETAISMLPRVLELFSSQMDVVVDLNAEIMQLSISPLFRRRMTFVACQQARALYKPRAGQTGGACGDGDLLESIVGLVEDTVEDVRIGIARLLGVLYVKFFHDSHHLPAILVSLIQRLSADPSNEVKSYLPDVEHDSVISEGGQLSLVNYENIFHRKTLHPRTFSRPPFYHVFHHLPNDPSIGHHLGNRIEGDSAIERNESETKSSESRMGQVGLVWPLSPSVSGDEVDVHSVPIKHEVLATAWMDTDDVQAVGEESGS